MLNYSPLFTSLLLRYELGSDVQSRLTGAYRLRIVACRRQHRWMFAKPVAGLP